MQVHGNVLIRGWSQRERFDELRQLSEGRDLLPMVTEW